MPATIRDVLRTLTADPGRPRLTWYGPDGERIELSGAVLVNWVSKTTNLLVEELDAEAGTVVALDLPPHWRTLVWALSAWQAGAEVRVVDGPDAPTGPPAPPADVVVTNTPGRWLGADGRRPARGDLVAVSLPALARRFDGELPAGAIDAASAVMTYADSLGYVTPTDTDATALSGPAPNGPTPDRSDLRVAHGDLLPWALAGTPDDAAPPASARALVRTSEGALGTVALLRTCLQVWAADGSVVVLAQTTARELDADPERLARLVATERVTQT
ncbi:TIGR03089 family protein [Sanguibacter sp. 25GB23B1]|uniref:TIGR03089 family protein n=1 Tax=unclassified Sanguibacter TaxID=2645534 RepID=UPI0032AF8E9C